MDKPVPPHKNGRRGQVQLFVAIILAVFVGVLAFTILPLMLAGSSVRASVARLESEGYTVLTSAEYDNIIALLNSIDTKADAAVANAEAAVVAAQSAADQVDLFNSAEVFLFPEDTTLTCVLTAGNTNVWSAWTEVADNATTTLSSKFAANPGYVSDMLFFLPSDAADGYHIELAYGAAKTILGRTAVWALASGDIAYVMPIKSRRVPAGETVYYRMQSTGANGATMQARFRYFYE